MSERESADVGTVAFIHVPKAGGMSYGRLLSEILPGEHWFPPVGQGMTPQEAHQLFTPEMASRLSLVGGHLDFDICRRVPTMRPVTVLRDPIDRLVSAYHYCLLGEVPDTAPWREHLLRNDISLFDFLHDDELMGAATSLAVPQIAGCLWSGQPAPASDDELFALALRNLESCVHVGIHERLDDSARLLGVDLGIGAIPALPHLNRSGGGSVELPPDLRAHLEESLALDYRLYRAACALFEERFAASGLTPAVVEPTARTLLPERAFDPSGVGAWIELEGRPAPGTTLGGSFDDVVPVAALALDRVVDQAGDAFVAERHPTAAVGTNWVRVGPGVHHLEATVWCAPDGPNEPDPWVVAFNLAWCRDDPFWRTSEVAIPGFPAQPDVIVSRVVPVPAALPMPAGASVPVSISLAIRAPGVGHLCLLMGSSRPVHASAGDRLSLLYVKIA